ncbi:pitrilysin family protein [Microbispora sp. NBRC 16548]|uniref:M16 family metallopeptidase n=1 Tax=Microbispora sp. NBRC 16548 TaxID=3030994 RepID=UPI0024A10F8C|nr:pitrilysin family protein [Microbispora sp. NBRC 16548]GLX05630.1 peptidase M16 [Microbispora sp. NBRC 16548]
MVTATATRPAPARLLPAFGPERPFRMPETVDAVLSNGLRVLAVRSPSVPLVEVRVRLPLPAPEPGLNAAAQILCSLLLRRTAGRTPEAIDDAMGRAGASLHCATDERWLGVYGSTTAAGLHMVLDVLMEALVSPSHDDADLAVARRRLVEKIRVTRAQPRVLAREALRVHRHGALPALRLTPDERAVSGITAEQVLALHRQVLRPRGALLVLVGDIDPHAVVHHLEAVTRGWRSSGTAVRSSYRPPLIGSGIALVDRPGAVQSQVVLAAPAPPRTDPRFAALNVATMVVGGYFSSRLVSRLREEEGLAYRVDAGLDDVFDDSSVVIDVDTATDATARAVRLIRSELDDLTGGGASEEEIESARRYLLGMTAVGLGSQSALATALSNAVGFGHEPHWLVSQPEELRRLRHTEVRAAIEEFYAPSRFTGVITGDAARLADILTPADLTW